MKPSVKYIVYGVLGLIGLALAGLAIFALTFNPNDYKPMIIDLVKEKKQRTLTIEGDIGLAFWPKLGANLGRISISEYQSSQAFASVNNVKVALAVLPLLRNELVVDAIYVDGAKVKVVKRKDGTFNFDDLLSKDAEETEQIKFDVDGVHITNSEVSYTDESTAADYTIEQFNLESGRIALAVPVDLATNFSIKANQPFVDAKVNIKGNFLFDPETKHFSAKKLDSLISGSLQEARNVNVRLNGNVDTKLDSMALDVKGLALVASADMRGANHKLDLTAPALDILKDQISSQNVTIKLAQTKPDHVLTLNMTLADMKGSPKAIQTSGISGDLLLVQGKRTVASKFSSPFNGNLEQRVFDIPKLTGNINMKDPALPNGGINGTFAIGAHAALKDEQANTHFNLVLADTKLNGDVKVAGFSRPNIKFNLNADKLDLNKLLSKPSQGASQPAEKGNGKPVDLSVLSNLLLDGKVNIGSISYDKHLVSGLNVAIKANGEKLVLNGLNLKVDDSQIKGQLAISQFSNPLYTFDIEVDQVNLDHYLPAVPDTPAKSKPQTDNPLDLSALKALNAQGSIRVGSLKHGKIKASNINIKLTADGQKLDVDPLSVKLDNSQIHGRFGIRQFSNPVFAFNVHIDKLDADQYIAGNDTPAPANKSNPDTPIDLSALKKLNASGEATIDWFKLANVKTERVSIGLNLTDGVAKISPFSANLYQGSMSGLLNVDARATPNISFKQNMKGIAIGPLLADAINNAMLAGKGSLNVDVTTQGNTVGALKKALAGNAALSLTDGAIKGIDIAGSIRDLKSKVNVFQSKDAIATDEHKKTDFSELKASFTIKNGVAHNNDLEMKAPILRLAKGDSKGNFDIANQTIDYSAKPTIVKTLKGQGGADIDQLAGIGIPIKITGTFANPKFGMDMSAVASGLAQSKLLGKVGGEKGAAVKELVGGDNKVDALKGLLNKKKPAETTDAESSPVPEEAPKSLKEETKEKALKKLLNF